MAVTAFEELAENRPGTIGGFGNTRLTRVFRCTTNNQFDNPFTLYEDPNFGVARFDSHPSYPQAIAREVQFTPETKGPGQSTWIVTVPYSDEPIDTQTLESQETEPNPVNRQGVVDIEGFLYEESTTEALDNDGNRVAMLTSAGEPYPPLGIDAPRWSANFEKNYPVIPDWVFTHLNTVNESSVLVQGRIVQAGWLKCNSLRVSRLKVENNVAFYTVSGSLHYQGKAWTVDRLDAGFHYLDASDNYVETGASTEQLLDGSGGLLSDIIDNIEPGDESYNTFTVYKTADHSVFPLNDGI